MSHISSTLYDRHQRAVPCLAVPSRQERPRQANVEKSRLYIGNEKETQTLPRKTSPGGDGGVPARYSQPGARAADDPWPGPATSPGAWSRWIQSRIT
jgi:hypothetical protein